MGHLLQEKIHANTGKDRAIYWNELTKKEMNNQP